MKQSAKVKEVLLLTGLIAIMTLIFTGTAFAADAISLQANEPATIYYTTSGADPSATSPAATKTYTNYYVVEGTKVTPPTVVPASETISLAPDAGKSSRYAKPAKLKIHESKREFEKHVKEKHGLRYKVEEFRIKQTDNGLDGYIDIVESRNAEILQLGDQCTEEERAKRMALAKNVLLNEPELFGLTENIELRERGIHRQDCNGLRFDTYINGYQLRSVFQVDFAPHWNYSISVHLDAITPEMYAAAQTDALPPEEIARIVYQDLGIRVEGKTGKEPPRLEMNKYLTNEKPYVYWRVAYRNIYHINAITGEILFKAPNVKY